MSRIRPLAVLSLFLFAACHTPDAAPQPASAPAGEHAYVLVNLKTGPKQDLSKDESAKVFQGHFANMEKLAREGSLVLAGPFGRGASAGLRGIFVFDVAGKAAAAPLAATDPGVQAGVFVYEPHDFTTAAPLRAVCDAAIAEQDQAAREGRTLAPGANCRNYVLLIADDGDRARAALATQAGVLLLARYDGNGAFAVLDAQNVAAAEALLGADRARIGPHHFEPWFATNHLATTGAPQKAR